MLMDLFVDYLFYLSSAAAMGLSTELYWQLVEPLQVALIARDADFHPGDYPSLAATPEAIQIAHTVRVLDDLWYPLIELGTMEVSFAEGSPFVSFLEAGETFQATLDTLDANALDAPPRMRMPSPNNFDLVVDTKEFRYRS